MIHFLQNQDMLKGNHQAIVNPVNTVGVMGAGLALEISKRYPEACSLYNYLCKRDTLEGGTVKCYPNRDSDSPQFIIMFATKEHYKDRSHISYIETGLKNLVGVIRTAKITNIGIPALGCGLGKLKWDKVKALILKELKQIEGSCEIYIYEPNNANKN